MSRIEIILKDAKRRTSVMEALTETGFVIAGLSLIVELIDNSLQWNPPYSGAERDLS